MLFVDVLDIHAFRTLHVNLILNVSLVIWCFEHGDAIEMHDKISLSSTQDCQLWYITVYEQVTV